MSRRFEIDLVPAALIAGLIALLAAQLLTDPPGVESVTAVAAQSLPPLPAVAPLPSTAAIEARPLFDPTRGAGPVSEASGVSATIDGVTLVGVARRGRRAVAVLRGADGVIHSVEPGQQVLGWTLDAVRADTIDLVRGDEHRSIAVGSVAAKVPGA